MIGLDTNVLVRYLAQDEAKQAALATRLVERQLSAAQPGFVSLVVLAELCWVLKRLYGASFAELEETVADMLGLPQFHLERREVVQSAVALAKRTKGGKTGFVDAIISALAQAEGCTHTLTFDKDAARSAGMKLLA